MIDGCIQLKREHKLEPQDIDAVSLRVGPLVPELTGKLTPQNGLEGKFSVYHAAAAGVVHGAAGEPQFADAVVRDPRLIAVPSASPAKPTLRSTSWRRTFRSACATAARLQSMSSTRSEASKGP